MTRRGLALGLALGLLLTGCSAMLERSYQSVTPHSRLSVAEDDSNAVWVESYSELQSAILSQVKAHQERGVVRLRNWKEDVEESLSRACDEVYREDPIGAYAVDGIRHPFTRMVTYYEAAIIIDYRRSAEQIAAVATVTGNGAIRAELADALEQFAPEAVFQMNYFDPAQDDAYIRALLHEVYYSLPEVALGLPEVQVNLYPESGSSRVVEVLLTYPEDPAALAAKRTALEEAALDLAEPYQSGLGAEALVPALYGALKSRAAGGGEAEPGSTAYAALVEGAADSEGMALAYKQLCDLTGVECRVVEGELDGTRHVWTIVAVGSGYRHVDPYGEDGLLRTDEEMEEAGYAWSRESYPACVPESAGEKNEN